MASNDFDIAITGGTLLTLSANMEIIEDATIGIRDGRIALVDKHRLLSAKKSLTHKAILFYRDWSTRTHTCRWSVSGAWRMICR